MDNMADLFGFFELSNKLKSTKRWGDTPQMVTKESSADHSWHLMLMVYVLNNEMNLNLDLLRALKIALLHDLAEALCGDVDNGLIHRGIITKEEKLSREQSALVQIIEGLSVKLQSEIKELMHDYENGISEEAKIVKAIDKIESIDHMFYMGMKTFDHPDWIASHPNKAVSDAPRLKPFLEELHRRLRVTYKELGWEWKSEYSDF